jgi:hypothetical protein
MGSEKNSVSCVNLVCVLLRNVANMGTVKVMQWLNLKEITYSEKRLILLEFQKFLCSLNKRLHIDIY